MSFINKLRTIPRLAKKNLVIGGIFTLALAGSVALGVASRQFTHAAVIRDTDSVNSIDGCNINGGIGAADPTELIKDIKANCNKDLATIYSHFGLTPDKYDKFVNEAREGLIWRDGHVTVDGQTVMDGVKTMGRTTLGNKQRTPYVINGVTYYESSPDISFAASRQNLPVMVLFDDQGVAQTLIMNACGNTAHGNPKVPKATCNALVSSQPDATNKPNTYSYTTDASFTNNASLSRVVYHFSDGTPDVTKTSLTDAVEHTWKADGKVSVTVYAKVPGGHEIKAAVLNCEKQVKHVAPMAVCTALVPTTLDDKNQKFRFTIKTATKYAEVKSAAMGVDGKTAEAVTTKDANGNYYKEYEFTDTAKHTVKATVTFTTIEGTTLSADCDAKVQSSKTPVCEVPGHEGQPINDQCGYCKPGIPIGDAKCTPQVLGAKLVDTGPGDVLGIFAGTSALGAIGHRVFMKRRAARR
ncbi:MAG TPA: hypothetical protein VLH86_02345 [Patescibacteria group bacterium]|nr:hypothetical protein [Patescibacteria group bacterium]